MDWKRYCCDLCQRVYCLCFPVRVLQYPVLHLGLLILLNLLCLVSPFHRLQVRSSRCFWCLPPVCKVGSVGCVGFLVEGTGDCVLVDEAGSCLSGGQDRVQWCVLRCL